MNGLTKICIPFNLEASAGKTKSPITDILLLLDNDRISSFNCNWRVTDISYYTGLKQAVNHKITQSRLLFYYVPDPL